MSDPTKSDYKGLITLPWSGGFAYHQFDVYFEWTGGVPHMMHFLFDPKILSLKYLFLDEDDIFTHVESINPYSFTDADFAPYNSCKKNTEKPMNVFSKMIKSQSLMMF